MKQITKKTVLNLVLVTLLFTVFFSPLQTFAQSKSFFVNLCTDTVPASDTGFTWAASTNAIYYPVADQNGSCTWTGPAVCNATSDGLLGTYESYTTGPGSEYTSTQYQCVGEFGSVNVSIVTISASPNSINLGSNTTITWSSTENTSSCNASGGWSGVKSSSGSEVVTPTTSSAYTLTCSSVTTSSDPQTAQVNVNTLATINVTSNLSSATWQVDSQTQTGSGSIMVTPGSSGTGYNFLPQVVSGYTSSVSPVNPVFLIPGDVASLSVTYSAIPPAFNYTLSATPVTVSQGSDSQATLVTSTLIQGLSSELSQNVYLTLSGLPSGVSATYAPQPCLPNCITNVGIRVSGSAIPGTYPVTVTGNTAEGGYVRTANFILTIQQAMSFTVSCSASPASIIIGQPVTWTALTTGNVGSLTYEWVGDEMPVAPGPSSNPHTISYLGTGPKTASVRVTDGGVALGGESMISCPPVTVQLKVKPSFQEI